MKIVALDAEPSLAAALNMTDWEVAFAADPEHAVEEIAGANLLLIGGGTDEGLRLAEDMRALGATIPALIVGDTESPSGARFPVLIRPFTLDELHVAVERAVSGSQQSAPPMPVAVPSAPKEEKPLPPAPSKVEPKPPLPAPPPAEQPVRRAHLEVARGSAVASASSATVAPAGATAQVVVPMEEVQAAQPSTSPVHHQPVSETKPKEAPLAPPPQSRRAAVERKLLRRGAKAGPSEPVEVPVSSNLREAYNTIRSVEKALDDLPVLADLRDLTQALLSEVVDLLTPDTAGIYLPGPDGFRVWASHNFSNVEKTQAVQTHQPLFADLLVRHESVLIEPLDRAQQLAGGVGGARTTAFLATPIEVNRKCVGIIVAGRGHFENEDLDRLAALADEAALGLGVALGLDRLRTKLS